MAEQLVDQSIDEVCAEVCGTLDGEAYLVNPSASILTALVDWGVDHTDSLPPMRLLGDEVTLKRTFTEFTVASRTAELVEHDLLEIRTHRDPPKTSLATDGDNLIVLIDAGECVGALATNTEQFVGELHATCIDRFTESDRYTLHTPAFSLIESSLADQLGDDRIADFTELVDAAAFDGLVDEVIISLLVAARHGDLLYDISKWGEDIGLASKATFSRKKTVLEDAGLITTESEPIEVGRPRLRLFLTDPSLADAPADTVIDEVHRRLE